MEGLLIPMACLLFITTCISVTFMVSNTSEDWVSFRSLFRFIRLPFKFPYKYKLGVWETSAFHTKNQCREMVINGKVTKWYGIIEVGVKENGLWGYTDFLLKGVGVIDGFQLEPGTDLIRLLQEGKEFTKVLKTNDVQLQMESKLAEQMRDLENKINNLKVIERINNEIN